MSKYPCVFNTPFHKEQVNLRLAGTPRSVKKVPFGDFTRTWKQEHCARINPYGSESCPYRPEDCSMAFLNVAQRALEMDQPGAFFRVHAKYAGIDRADNKPLARERYDRTDGQQEGPGSLRGGPRAGPDDVLPVVSDRHHDDPRAVDGVGPVGLRRTAHHRDNRPRPQSMGSLLRGDDPGPRTRAYGRHEEQESPDHDGNRRDPVPSPPPERLGNQPPSGDPDLHQGGE